MYLAWTYFANMGFTITGRWLSWSKALDLKSREVKASVGSNPTLPAICQTFNKNSLIK